jgi:alpha-glucoside transport system permease protein
MTDRAIQVVVASVVIPALLFGYLAVAEAILRLLPQRRQPAARPWLWLAPALGFLAVFLLVPLLNTVVLSALDASSRRFVGLENFSALLGDPAMRIAGRNSVAWLVFLTAITVGLGLVLAVLTDRVRFERTAKAILFMPLAISFVAAGVIWRFMYEYRPPGSPQTGTLNALVTGLGGSPQTWLVDSPTNTGALILATAWMFTGFCLVILSAGLKGLPGELLEAARVDGATEWQVFRRIIVPLLGPTIAVVATTMAISALKAFDIVYVMTNGNFETDVIGTAMYKALFSTRDFGQASSIAVVLLLVVLPLVAWNLRVFRRQESVR